MPSMNESRASFSKRSSVFQLPIPRRESTFTATPVEMSPAAAGAFSTAHSKASQVAPEPGGFEKALWVCRRCCRDGK